ncbi:MAG: hypothetical protein RLZZ74_660 [Cyanobacteriota bacterium]|jgi:hypothetical protein
MSFPERDLQSKLDEMEADLNQQADSNVADPSKSVLPKLEINPTPQVQGWIDKSKDLFNNLPQFGKVAVAVGGVWLGFSIVGAILHVVSSIFSVAAIGVVLYVGYRLFTNNSEPN